MKQNNGLFAIILTVPTITPHRPSLGPAIIKTVLEQNNRTATWVDINIDFWNRYQKKYGRESFLELDGYFNWPDRKELSKKTKENYSSWSNEWVEKILKYNAEHILISVFTWNAQRFTKDFLKLLKPKTKAKIIIGGQGIGEVREQTSFIDSPLYALHMKKEGLIDHFIKGDAETTLPLICKYTYTGIGIDDEKYAPMGNLKELKIPNYDDINIKEYHTGGEQQLPLEISRGCVRKCYFCDWPLAGGGFRTKTGEQVFEEVKYQYEKYNVTNYYFNDALMNGSIKEFNTFNQLLLDYYRANNLPDRTMHYSGHWIVRGPHQGWKKEYIDLMGRAGAGLMVVGIESGSDKIKNDMNKRFTNKDIDYNIERFEKWGIGLYVHIIIGYPTETDEDFNETLEFLKRYQKYVAKGVIQGINFGQTFTMEEGTPLYFAPEKLGLKGINGNPPTKMFWMNPKNPKLTYKERILRRIRAAEVATELGYPQWGGNPQLTRLKYFYTNIQTESLNEHKIAI